MSGPFFLGIDLGGTRIKAGICDGKARPIDHASIPTDADHGPEETMNRMAELGRRLMGARKAAACGIGVPGPLDLDRRMILRATNLKGWIKVRVPSGMKRRLGMPVIMENDANCAAFGEYQAGSPCDCLVLYTLGTGIGGGIVIHGKLWVGASGAAGELGHMTLDPRGPKCGCGQRGCIEAMASATAVARAYGLPAHEAFAALRRGDPRAKRVIDDACDKLGMAVANMIHVLHPDRIVLAGGMAAAGKPLFDRVRASVRKRVFPVCLEKIRIEPGRLGGDAGWIGAALWAREKLT